MLTVFAGGVALVRFFPKNKFKKRLTFNFIKMRHALIRFLTALDVDAAWFVLYPLYFGKTLTLFLF
jgi:hypothetical protein